MKTKNSKVFETDQKHYSYGVSDGYNIKVRRVSRWIHVECRYVTKNHSLYDYGDAYCEEEKKNPVLYFKHNNRLYALNQFMRLSSPMFFEDEEGKTSFLSGYDATEYYYPYLIEISESGDYIRLYEELKEWEYERREDRCDG